jgi:putative transposase
MQTRLTSRCGVTGCIFIGPSTASETPLISGLASIATWLQPSGSSQRRLKRHGRPQRIVIDGSQTNREAITSCDMTSRLQERRRLHTKPIRIRQSQYLNNLIEQDHRRIKRRVRPMLGFKAFSSATITLAGIEMVQMMRKRQGRYSYNPSPSLAEQFHALAAAS